MHFLRFIAERRSMLIACSVLICFIDILISVHASGTLQLPTSELARSKIFVGYRLLSPKEKTDLIRRLGNENEVYAASSITSVRNNIDIPGDAEFVYVSGFRKAGDGGDGLFAIEKIDAQKTEPNVDGVVVLSTNNPALILKRIHTGSLDLRAIGAKGDGVTDDTHALRGVLNTRLDVSNKCAKCIFLVGPTSNPGDSKQQRRSALIIYAGQKLDLNGATLRLRDHSNSFLLANNGTFVEGESDAKISIFNTIFDGNVQSQKATNIGKGDPFSPTILLNSVEHTSLKNIEIKNYYGSGLYINRWEGPSSKNVELDGIRINNGLGPGMHVTGENFTIGTVEVRGARSFMEGGKAVHFWGAHPNSIAATLQYSTIESISYKDCAWGFKLQDGSKNVRIGSIIAEGVTEGQAVKFQGTDDERGYRPNDNVVVDSVISSNNNYNGLYVIYNTNIRIKSYKGTNNGLAYKSKLDPWHHDPQNFYDALIIKSDAIIDEIVSRDSKVGVLYSHESGEKTKKTRRIGRIEVLSGRMNNAVYLRQSNNEINELVINDDVKGLDSAVYFDRAPNDVRSGNLVKALRVAEGVLKPRQAEEPCRGTGSYMCSFIKVGRTDLFAIESGNRLER